MGDGNLYEREKCNHVGGICLVEIIPSTFPSTGHERGVFQLLQWSECVHRQRRLLYSDDEDGMEAMRVF